MQERKLILPNQAVWQSVLSFVIACLITALLLFQLVRPWHKKPTPETRYITLDLSFMPKAMTKTPSADAGAVSKKTDIAKMPERETRQRASPSAQQAAQAITLPTAEPSWQDPGKDVFTEEKSTVSSGLRTDKDAIARAYADSRSDLQKLASRSGQPLEATERSPIRKFGREVSKAQITDCIKPNPEGITIGQVTYKGYFAAAALAYNAVTGQCK
ncbi:hypothetical protein UNDKW_3899 [Undibacterium sp. KW1]|uniref:hypothetical protein n=1 Tax=Undibacterium sp. KW1 TaxID=2058624 RepID=UPI001331E018|nr:hypothetical protein [Undibacterium sp. KW1]BBB62172.1 hypothetical protein UNDKW_3899 [Undibacterium sp. KW1]